MRQIGNLWENGCVSGGNWQKTASFFDAGFGVGMGADGGDRPVLHGVRSSLHGVESVFARGGVGICTGLSRNWTTLWSFALGLFHICEGRLSHADRRTGPVCPARTDSPPEAGLWRTGCSFLPEDAEPRRERD